MTYQATITEHRVDRQPIVVWASIAAIVLTVFIWAQAQIGIIDPNQGPPCDQTSGLLTQSATPSNILPPCMDNPNTGQRYEITRPAGQQSGQKK